mmetsp:Transcript_50735/g.110099  ORF Transcript_50735/g.110099 Transcript_50735/m.110099 type:complete len:201 (+) Transcript_50735:291-893(+)
MAAVLAETLAILRTASRRFGSRLQSLLGAKKRLLPACGADRRPSTVTLSRSSSTRILSSLRPRIRRGWIAGCLLSAVASGAKRASQRLKRMCSPCEGPFLKWFPASLSRLAARVQKVLVSAGVRRFCSHCLEAGELFLFTLLHFCAWLRSLILSRSLASQVFACGSQLRPFFLRTLHPTCCRRRLAMNSLKCSMPGQSCP